MTDVNVWFALVGALVLVAFVVASLIRHDDKPRTGNLLSKLRPSGKWFRSWKISPALGIALLVLLLAGVTFAGCWWLGKNNLPVPFTEKTVVCPNIAADKAHGCVLNSAWSSWVHLEGRRENGMWVCASPGGQTQKEHVQGMTLWRFRSGGGKLVKTYRAYPQNHPCPDVIR